MSTKEELGSALGVRAAIDQLDDYLTRRGVSEDAREAVTNSLAMMYEYIPYAIKQHKDPSDPKVLAEFLATKGKHMAKYLGNDGLNCGLAIFDLIQSLTTSAKATSTGVPITITLAWGLAMLDLIEVGIACEPAQQAYYELFLKESSVKLAPVRRQVQNALMTAIP